LSDTSIPLPTRLLTSDQVKETLHVINATSDNVDARNYIHGKFGKFVNLIKIVYLQRRETAVLDSTKDDIDHMLENFESSNKISFVSLSDVPVKDFLNQFTILITFNPSMTWKQSQLQPPKGFQVVFIIEK